LGHKDWGEWGCDDPFKRTPFSKGPPVLLEVNTDGKDRSERDHDDPFKRTPFPKGPTVPLELNTVSRAPNYPKQKGDKEVEVLDPSLLYYVPRKVCSCVLQFALDATSGLN